MDKALIEDGRNGVYHKALDLTSDSLMDNQTDEKTDKYIDG